MTLEDQRGDQRIEEIERLAEGVFGSKEKARQWLASPNLALGASPESMLDTAEGRNEVRKMLAAIAAGGAV